MGFEPIVRGKGTLVGGVMGGGKSLISVGSALRDQAEGRPHIVSWLVDAVKDEEHPDWVTSRSGLVYKGAFVYRKVEELVQVVNQRQPKTIYQIDAHFADKYPGESEALYLANKRWLEEGREVVIDTLERDFRGDTFLVAGLLYGLCDVKYFLTRTCQHPGCESDATFNQKSFHGRPVHRGVPRFEVDSPDFRKFKSYEARCRKHFFCPEEIDPILKGILESNEKTRQDGRDAGYIEGRIDERDGVTMLGPEVLADLEVSPRSSDHVQLFLETPEGIEPRKS